MAIYPFDQRNACAERDASDKLDPEAASRTLQRVIDRLREDRDEARAETAQLRERLLRRGEEAP